MQNDNFYALIQREIDIQRSVKSEHVVRVIDSARSANNFYIFTDLCEGGDLEKKLKKGHIFTEEEACEIIRQITDAFIAMGNIMHRDIKPANILLTKGGKIKVADFGFAKVVDGIDKHIRVRHTLLGTPLYMPPQILNDMSYTPKCDIWSTGILFYELLFGRTPWTGISIKNLSENILTKPLYFPKDIKHIQPETRDLLERMLEYDETHRISWEEIWVHPATNFKVIKNPQNHIQMREQPRLNIAQNIIKVNKENKDPQHNIPKPNNEKKQPQLKTLPIMKQIRNYMYNQAQPIDQNAFCKIYKAIDTRTNKELLIKVFSGVKIFKSTKFDELLHKQITIQKDFNREQIVRVVDFERTPNELYIITDLYEGSNLEKRLKEGPSLTEEEACDIVRQVTDIFVLMGDAVHCDINPTNILLKQGKVKVADFGVAKVIREAEKEIVQSRLSPYMSPQALNGKPLSIKDDIWSMGCVLYEALFGKTPWTESSVSSLFVNIRTKPLVFPKVTKAKTKDLLKGMLEYDENKRFSWEEIWAHPATNIIIKK